MQSVEPAAFHAGGFDIARSAPHTLLNQRDELYTYLMAVFYFPTPQLSTRCTSFSLFFFRRDFELRVSSWKIGTMHLYGFVRCTSFKKFKLQVDDTYICNNRTGELLGLQCLLSKSTIGLPCCIDRLNTLIVLHEKGHILPTTILVLISKLMQPFFSVSQSLGVYATFFVRVILAELFPPLSS